jgi:hypothetical protein
MRLRLRVARQQPRSSPSGRVDLSFPTLVYFFLACMTAGFGLWQTRFSRCFGRDSSRILLWLYSLFSVVFVACSWTFDLGSHFWNIPIQNDFYPPTVSS